MSAARYRKKPTDVDAIQWDGSNFTAVKDFAAGALGSGEVMNGALPLWVVKSQALCHVQRGDWIIREPDGSGFYPCAGDVFAATYESVGGSILGGCPRSERAEAKLAEIRSVLLEGGQDAGTARRRALAIIASKDPGYDRDFDGPSL